MRSPTGSVVPDSSIVTGIRRRTSSRAAMAPAGPLPITITRRSNDILRDSSGQSSVDPPAHQWIPDHSCPRWTIAGARHRRGRAGALAGEEVRRLPDPLVQIGLHIGDVLQSGVGVPAPRQPHADAAPKVAGGVVPAAVDGVEPRLVALEAVAPRRHG